MGQFLDTYVRRIITKGHCSSIIERHNGTIYVGQREYILTSFTLIKMTDDETDIRAYINNLLAKN